ncbi:hypothetical protein VNI00_011712 [Paramarasmius palmivorus]|uniref:Homeobox domain-containing protein n=1 Tax=Paramarasmius palmivorus TaxID=297713 RepID=A0AAW0CCW3_9AGAR
MDGHDDQVSAESPLQEASETSTTKKQTNRRYITNAGTALLKETFFDQKITLPTKEQKDDLLRRIHELPGCEGYTLGHLNAWFASRRKAQRDAQKQVTVVSSAYPTLNQESLETLSTLFKETPSPSQIVMSVWATLLKAKAADVEAWVYEQQQQKSQPPTPQTPSVPVPTSANPYLYHLSGPVITPFATPPNGSVYFVPPQPAVKTEQFTQWINAPLPPPSENQPDQVETDEVPLPTSPIARTKDLARSTLLLAIHDDLGSLKPPDKPSDINEFQAKFSPYQKMMDTLLERINDGSLEKWRLR